MLRTAIAAALAAILLAASGPALADTSPPATQIRKAAEQFDAGVAAFKQKDFEDAASRFEAADAAVPSARALRQAIRARSEAGQRSRAATLAAQAIERYPGDSQTQKLAREVLEKDGPKLHKVTVACASPCLLALGSRSIPGEPTARWTLYLDPGRAVLSASFASGKSALEKEIDAKAGGESEASFQPEPEKPKPDIPPPLQAKPLEEPPPPRKTPPHDATPKSSSGLPPAVFIAGVIATTGLAGGVLGSGIDTLNNPGVDVVRAKCAGKMEETCPEYQAGKRHETRTNILIGATAGVAAITAAIGIFFTNWGEPKNPSKGSYVVPSAVILPQGAMAGAAGMF